MNRLAPLTLLLLAGLPGCATIVNGRTQTVPINTYPGGAHVYVDEQLKGHTPLSVPMKRNEPHTVRLAMSGYPDHRVTLESKADAALIGNAVLGGFIGVAVDAISGAGFRLDPKRVYWDFQKRTDVDPDHPTHTAKPKVYQ
jgi:hypothetical protein